MEKKLDKKILKVRFIISSVILFLIFIGWIYFAIRSYYSNEEIILNKFLDIQNKIFLDQIEEIDLKNEINYTLDYEKNNKQKSISLNANFKDQKIYIRNDSEYYDIGKNLGKYNISTNSDNFLKKENYKIIYNSLINSILNNKTYIDGFINKDKKNNKYVYYYTLNDLLPMVSTLKTDANFVKAINETFSMSEEDISNLLDEIKLKRIELSLTTQGFKRNIVAYTIRIDSLLTISINAYNIRGYFNGIGFAIDTEKQTITLTSENDEIIIKDINKTDNKIKNNNYKEMTSLDLFSLFKLKN